MHHAQSCISGELEAKPSFQCRVAVCGVELDQTGDEVDDLEGLTSRLTWSLEQLNAQLGHDEEEHGRLAKSNSLRSFERET